MVVGSWLTPHVQTPPFKETPSLVEGKLQSISKNPERHVDGLSVGTRLVQETQEDLSVWDSTGGASAWAAYAAGP